MDATYPKTCPASSAARGGCRKNRKPPCKRLQGKSLLLEGISAVESGCKAVVRPSKGLATDLVTAITSGHNANTVTRA